MVEDGCNARQAADLIKRAQADGVDPDIPDEGEIDDSHTVDVYCDGSTKLPKQPMWSYGGFGVWAPRNRGVAVRMGPDNGATFREDDNEGIRLWNKGTTDRCNSTRMELMAVAAGMTIPHRIHIKSDNRAVVDKTRYMVARCRPL